MFNKISNVLNITPRPHLTLEIRAISIGGGGGLTEECYFVRWQTYLMSIHQEFSGNVEVSANRNG